jgi:putative transposase
MQEFKKPLEYLFHDRAVAANVCDRVCFATRKINLSTVFAGQNVGVKEVMKKSG